MRFNVKKIERKDYIEWIKNKHYAQRVPSVSFAYGLFEDAELIGCLTIGKPASNALCEGVLGKEYKQRVYELNRLITKDGLKRNVLSWFVSKVLRELKKENLILVSYADEGVGHCGYIYQATNWLYTGKTKERTDKYTPNGKHSRHYSDEFNHLRKFRTAKHRYIYFCCDKKRKKEYIKKLNYKIEKYPKMENRNYVLGERAKQKIINTITGEIYFE